MEFEFEFLGEKHVGKFCFDRYKSNNSYYICVLTKEINDFNGEEYWENWDDVTTNMSYYLGEDKVAILNGNCSDYDVTFVKRLVELKVLKKTGLVCSSGFNTYDVYQVDEEKLLEVCESLVELYKKGE